MVNKKLKQDFEEIKTLITEDRKEFFFLLFILFLILTLFFVVGYGVGHKSGVSACEEYYTDSEVLVPNQNLHYLIGNNEKREEMFENVVNSG